LRCCLSYEYCAYVEALKEMPRRKKRVMTPYGEGIVKDLAPISKTVFVAVPDHGIKELGIDEIKEINQQEQPEKSDNQNSQSNDPKRRGRRFRNRKKPNN